MSDDSVLERVFRKIHNELLDPFDEAPEMEPGETVFLPTGESDTRVLSIHARKIGVEARYPEGDTPFRGLS